MMSGKTKADPLTGSADCALIGKAARTLCATLRYSGQSPQDTWGPGVMPGKTKVDPLTGRADCGLFGKAEAKICCLEGTFW